MRNLGDLRWINDWVGIPYEGCGRGPDTYDCFGLCKAVYEDRYGIKLPDWLVDPIDIKARTGAIESAVTSGDFTEVDRPDDGDFVVCYRTKAAHHLGLSYAGGVLHCIEGTGVVYEPISRFRERFVRVVFGKWNP